MLSYVFFALKVSSKLEDSALWLTHIVIRSLKQPYLATLHVVYQETTFSIWCVVRKATFHGQA